MAKIMVFIDGSWLYANTPRLAESYGKKSFQIDFGKLPAVVAEAVREQLGNTEVDVVRTYLFGSYASNNHPADDAIVQRRLDFYDMLREEHHYEVEVFPINFRGRRLRKADRDPADTFEAKEKCVDISLATSMLYFAAIPFAYEIAIAVVGDQDFKPVLQHVRQLGKRVAIASIKEASPRSCRPHRPSAHQGLRPDLDRRPPPQTGVETRPPPTRVRVPDPQGHDARCGLPSTRAVARSSTAMTAKPN